MVERMSDADDWGLALQMAGQSHLDRCMQQGQACLFVWSQ